MEVRCPISLTPPLSLEVIHQLIQAVPDALDTFQMSHRTVHVLREALAADTLALYQMNAAEPLLCLLAQAAPSSSFPQALVLSSLTDASHPAFLALFQERTPFVLADLQEPETPFAAALSAVLGQQTGGLLSVPLWYGETFEGLLLATFPAPPRLDVTARKVLSSCATYVATLLSHTRLQQVMTEERQHSRAILDQVPAGILIADAISGHVRYANPLASQILGVALNKLVGAPLQLPVHALHQLSTQPTQSSAHAFWTFAISRALSGKTLHRVETMVVRPDGAVLPVVCSSAPLYTDQGRLGGAILIFEDITQQKRLERGKNAFLAFASHELRTPLTSVLGYADLLTQVISQREGESDLLQTAARAIATQAEQIAFLIEEMLDLSSLDQDQLVLHRAPYDLFALLMQVRDAQAKTTEKHEIHLNVEERTATGWTAYVDGPRIIQVLTNLVNNAIKYSPRGGAIELGMRLEGQTDQYPPTHARLWVKDQGLGIAQEDLPHLFERFYRSSRLEASLSGLGIGLYLVRQLVTRHGGRIWVESAIDQGSTFFVLLPLRERYLADANQRESPGSGS